LIHGKLTKRFDRVAAATINRHCPTSMQNCLYTPNGSVPSASWHMFAVIDRSRIERQKKATPDIRYL